MKSIRFSIIISIVFFLFFFGSAQTVTSCTTIHIYRTNVLSNSLVLLNVYINDVEIKELKNNAALKVIVPEAGKYTISARWGIRGEDYRARTREIINVDCQEEIYIKVKSGSLTAEKLLMKVYADEGKRDIKEIPAENINEVTIQQISSGNNLTSTSIKKHPEETNEEKKNEAVLARDGKETVSQETNINPATQSKNELNGNSYALIIAINQCEDHSMNDLDQPIKDASKLVDVLLRKYSFKKEHVLFLRNPKKDEITKALDNYFEQLNANDNLFIFYAGHGYWDEKFQQGYWLAADANRENRGTWLSNGTIRDYIRAIPTKHTLLVADACFGGGIFKSRAAFSNSSMAINQLYKLPSRKAMTSGAMSEVPDKSVFIQYLVKRLEQNTEKYLSSEQLFASFKIAVINNSSNGQVPQFGEIKETGDEGGDYIFIRK